MLLFPHTLFADEARVRFLAEKLRSDDFRVRTNAALALGASNEDSAVDPLCGALSDTSEVVRQASAVALKRLGRPRAATCLRARAGVEQNAGVKAEIARALEALNVSGGESSPLDPIKDNPRAKYYIALAPLSNSTGRAQREVEAIVLKRTKEALEAAKDPDSQDLSVQLAPPKESIDGAKAAIAKRKYKGTFYLAIAVDKFDYSGGRLTVAIHVAVFSYPGKSLIGNVDKTVSKTGVSGTDRASEDRLLDAAAERVTAEFLKNLSAFL